MNSSTERFEARLQTELAAIADSIELPPPDFQYRVRQRIALHRRRRRATVAAAVAAGAAVVLAASLGLSLPSRDSRVIVPAADGPSVTGPPGARPTATAASDTPWWAADSTARPTGGTAAGTSSDQASGPAGNAASGTATAPDSSAALQAFWDSKDSGPHDEVRLLDQEPTPSGFLLLVAGREPDGRRRILLLHSDRNAEQGLTDQSLLLLADWPAPSTPTAPIALAVGVPTDNVALILLAPPCGGGARVLSLDHTPGIAEVLWTQSRPGIWRTRITLPGDNRTSLRCDAPGDGVDHPLVQQSSGVPTAIGTVSLLTGE
ncbi:hypothetical protein ABH930_000580 [Kitasatospora sp. GAS204A]|uniref:hypothetical protein n=1 Tax=unclassified Kitasatospora TaxID=2633591 RepID=UPI002474DE7A|nr:hypothetical protein [Kitasatospora sp. GAS204B]MDH6119338.1 hypothetical protein [Kitasatospora sp. GAS204B]